MLVCIYLYVLHGDTWHQGYVDHRYQNCTKFQSMCTGAMGALAHFITVRRLSAPALEIFYQQSAPTVSKSYLGP